MQPTQTYSLAAVVQHSEALVFDRRRKNRRSAFVMLRWLFGSTRCVFDVDAPRLRHIEGLLDPRDLKPGGRWHEYLGTIEFTQPLDLRALAAQGARR